MRYPPAYVPKNWTNSSNPELGKLVDLWKDDYPVNTVSFAKTAFRDPRFDTKEEAPVRACVIPLVGTAWQVRSFTVYTSQDGIKKSPLFIVTARMPIPGDTLLVQFLGTSRDTVEQGRQLAMLRSVHLLGR